MQSEKVIQELQIWSIFILMACALAASVSYNVRLRDRLALQQQRIQNLQEIALALPADLRHEDGRKRKKPEDMSTAEILADMDVNLSEARKSLKEAQGILKGIK